MLQLHDISKLLIVNLLSLGFLVVGCGGDSGCGEQGSTRACVCDGGSQGTQYCQGNGDFSPCICSGANAITGSDGSTSSLDGGRYDGSASELGSDRESRREGGTSFIRSDSGRFRPRR